jgi:hypothetical protein
MLQQVWAEMDYQLGVCHFTKSSHIEHLQGMQKTKFGEFHFPSVGHM